MANAKAAETFNYKVVRQFALVTVLWGIVGMLVGVIIAAQLLWPQLNLDIPWLSYGRLRPLHTNAVIFAFGGCALFASSYYCV
jgi:cytochrome c oxidase cbb3-type subunit 1